MSKNTDDHLLAELRNIRAIAGQEDGPVFDDILMLVNSCIRLVLGRDL